MSVHVNLTEPISGKFINSDISSNKTHVSVSAFQSANPFVHILGFSVRIHYKEIEVMSYQYPYNCWG